MDICDAEDEDEDLSRLQLTIGEEHWIQQEGLDLDDCILAGIGVAVYGLNEARRLRSQRRHEKRLYLIRPDLLPNPRGNTPWQILYYGKNDRAYITTMGFDVETFHSILEHGFQEQWDSSPIPRADTNPNSVPRTGRRSLDASGALGLILHFLNSTIGDTSLCEIFALIPATVSRYISFSLKILLLTLRQMEDAQIRWPEGDEFQEANTLITVRHPLLTGAFGSMDGLKLAVQTSKDQEIENATYNGWLHDHFVSSVLAFGPDGVIIACNLNSPGSWHDSRVARPIFNKLRTRTPDGYYLVADTAFPRGTDQISGKIRAPVKDGVRLPANAAARKALMDEDRQLLSYRQTAEWSMRTLQGSFGRLRVPLPINYITLRADLLETIARSFNLRTCTVGYNQTRTVYKDVWTEEEQVWLNFEHMLFGDQRKNDRVGRFYHVAETA